VNRSKVVKVVAAGMGAVVIIQELMMIGEAGERTIREEDMVIGEEATMEGATIIGEEEATMIGEEEAILGKENIPRETTVAALAIVSVGPATMADTTTDIQRAKPRT
jgi:carbonic anhydrase/acetyltransferase-like protein (isoleucine patch superfamily)